MEQRTKEWFDARKGKLTGSNIGAALGVNPWKSPGDLIRQMVRDQHGAPSEFTGNVATEYGSMHEPLATMEYFGETGKLVEECGFYVHPEHDWLGASPDGLIGDDAIIEIKCPFGLRNKKEPDFKSSTEQPHYYAQMQVEMACTGRKECDFYQWSPHGSHIELVVFDSQWWSENLPKLKAFYDWFLSEIDNPLHLEDKEKEINTLGSKSLLDEYDRLSAAIDDASARKKEILSELVVMAKERNSIVHGRKLSKVERKGNVVYSKVPELKGVDLEPYRGKAVEYWRLS
jgi:putative phage-type endonuclease